MAQRTTLSQERPMQTAKEGDQERNRIFDAFRRWGYLEARLDPLGIFEPLKHPDLEGLSGELAKRLVASTVAPLAPTSCIWPSRNAAAGSLSESKLPRKKLTRTRSSSG